jgi:hypothetical protein
VAADLKFPVNIRGCSDLALVGYDIYESQRQAGFFI